MWEAAIDGRQLTFHLAGINNQNFIMRDDETGSWWQQVTGEAIQGPLKGRRLAWIPHDELTFATWKQEKGRGRVLRPDESAPWRRFSENWEEKTAALPVVTPAGPDEPLPPREVVVGVALGGAAKAYPLARVLGEAPILDSVGGTPLVVVVAEDGQSVRVFEAAVDGQAAEFYAKAGGGPLRLVDDATGSEWDFTGRAVSGPRAGARLRQLPALKDYWFDWRAYNPSTAVYGGAGAP